MSPATCDQLIFDARARIRADERLIEQLKSALLVNELREALEGMLHQFNLDDLSVFDSDQQKALRNAELAFAKAGGTK